MGLEDSGGRENQIRRAKRKPTTKFVVPLSTHWEVAGADGAMEDRQEQVSKVAQPEQVIYEIANPTRKNAKQSEDSLEENARRKGCRVGEAIAGDR